MSCTKCGQTSCGQCIPQSDVDSELRAWWSGKPLATTSMARSSLASTAHPFELHPFELHPSKLRPSKLHELHPSELHPSELHSSELHPPNCTRQKHTASRQNLAQQPGLPGLAHCLPTCQAHLTIASAPANTQRPSRTTRKASTATASAKRRRPTLARPERHRPLCFRPTAHEVHGLGTPRSYRFQRNNH